MATKDISMESTFGDQSQWSLLPVPLPNVATEDHLQSLGFEINDGLPKFRLNEPGPAALASSIFQQNNMVTDETQQSVGLGSASFEIIREASLANYMEIQQKSASTDYVSQISMMSPTEIEESLKMVLDENMKLKETLRQNNRAIKEQFNTISTWQKEVMTICDNHKLKFRDTKDLVNRLKKENDELREKISKNSHDSSLNGSASGFSLENVNAASLVEKPHVDPLITTDPSFTSLASTVAPNLDIEKLSNNENQMKNEQELLKRIDTLSDELNKVKADHLKTQELLQEKEKRYMTDIELFSQQLQKSNVELEHLKQNSDASSSCELQKFVDKCCQKDMELKYLKEIVSSLEQQIKRFEGNALSLADVQVETFAEAWQDDSLLKDNVEMYNSKLKDLDKCFSAMCDHFLKVQELLKESANIIHIFETTDFTSNDSLTDDRIKNHKDKLCDYRRKLIDEQLQTITDKQTIVKIQQAFQKIFSDYNSVVYELNILKDENSKLMTMQIKVAEENSQKLSEIEKHLADEKKILEDGRASFLEERLHLQMEKKLVADDKERIKAERNSLQSEKEKLDAAMASLLCEKISLDRQSKLYEAEEGTIQEEKKVLQKKCEILTKQIENFKQELHAAEETIQLLRIDNDKLKENEEMISVYRIQTEMHLKEFEEMHSTQKNLQDQLQSLATYNVQLRTENDRLTGQCPQNDQLRRFCSLCAKFITQGEQHGIGNCTPAVD